MLTNTLPIVHGIIVFNLYFLYNICIFYKNFALLEALMRSTPKINTKLKKKGEGDPTFLMWKIKIIKCSPILE